MPQVKCSFLKSRQAIVSEEIKEGGKLLFDANGVSEEISIEAANKLTQLPEFELVDKTSISETKSEETATLFNQEAQAEAVPQAGPETKVENGLGYIKNPQTNRWKRYPELDEKPNN